MLSPHRPSPPKGASAASTAARSPWETRPRASADRAASRSRSGCRCAVAQSSSVRSGAVAGTGPTRSRTPTYAG